MDRGDDTADADRPAAPVAASRAAKATSDADAPAGAGPDEPDGPIPSRSRSVCSRLPLAVPVLAALVGGWSMRWVSDDGFIYLRVAKQIGAGNGPVLNAGERVEAATSVQWVWALAALHALTSLRLEHAALALGLACTAAAFALVQAASVRSWRAAGASPVLWLPGAALVLACWKPVWDFATSGLETPLALVWIATAFLVLTRPTPAHTRILALEALVLAAAWLVRPDLAVMAAVMGAGWLVARRDVGARRLALAAALGAAPVLAYQLWRMSYFAALAPNPALTKEAGDLRLSRGLTYLADAGHGYWLWPIVACFVAALGVLVVRRGPKTMAAPLFVAVAGAAHLAYVAAVGGDFMHARLAIPGVFALLAPFAAVPLSRVGAASSAACAALALALAGFGRPVPEGPSVTMPLATTNTGVTDERSYYTAATGLEHPLTAEQIASGEGFYSALAETVFEFRDKTRTGWRGALGPTGDGDAYLPAQLSGPAPTGISVGLVGLASFIADEDTYVADTLGLADPLVARTRVLTPGRPGHEKGVSVSWGAAMMGLPPNQEGLTPGYAEELAGTTNAIRCGWAGELLDTIRSPWTPSVALRSLTNAPRWWSQRVSPDPLTAEIELCGRE